MSEKIVNIEKFDFEEFKSKSQMICKKVQIKVYSSKSNEIALVKDLNLRILEDISNIDLSHFIIIEDEFKNKKWFEIYELRALVEYLYSIYFKKDKQIDKERNKFIKYCESSRIDFVNKFNLVPRNNIDKVNTENFVLCFEQLLSRFKENE